MRRPAVVAAPVPGPTEQPLLAPPPIDWAAVDPTDERSVLGAWQALDLRGHSWELAMEAVPDDAILLQAMATVQLHHANLDCPSQGRATGCLPDPGVYAAAPDATWTDPCLQRELALWSVAQLEWPDLAAEPALLRRLVTRPNDTDLAAAILDDMIDLPTAQQLELITAAVGAGNTAATTAALAHLPPEELPALASALDLDDGFALMSVGPFDPAIHAGMFDEGLRPTTRIRLMRLLVDDAIFQEFGPESDASEGPARDAAIAKAHYRALLRSPLARDLTTLARGATPMVAAAALDCLAHWGQAKPEKLLRAPWSTAELIRQLAIAAIRGAPLGSLIDPKGVAVIDTTLPGPAPDAVPTPPTRALARQADPVPFGDELVAMADRCTGATCTDAIGTSLTFTATRHAGHVALAGIARLDPGECRQLPTQPH